MPVSEETVASIQRNLAAISVSDMEAGVNVMSQTLCERQARKRLHQLAEQARDTGIANSAHAEASSAAASSSGRDSYGAEGEAGSLEYENVRERYKQDMAAFITRKRDLDTQLQQEEEDLWQTSIKE